MTRIIAALLILGSSASAQVKDDSRLYAKAIGSVVWICALDKDGEESFGSGVVVGDGKILTTIEVVDKQALIWAHSPERGEDGRVISSRAHYRSKDATSMRCVVETIDAMSGLALLSVKKGERRGDSIRLAKVGPSPGQAVFTIGSNSVALFGYAGGNVRQTFVESIVMDGGPNNVDVIELTQDTYQTDVGGPIFNRNGALVGINRNFGSESYLSRKGVHVSEIRKFLEKAMK